MRTKSGDERTCDRGQVAVKTGARPAPVPAWGLPAVLGVACLLPIVLRFGQGGQAATVDLGAAFLGLAGTIAAVGLLLGARVSRIGARVARPWIGFLGVGLVSAWASGRVWSAFVGEVSNMLGWSSLVAMTAIALAAAAHAEEIDTLLVRYGFWVLLLQSVLAFGQLTGLADVAGAGTLPNSTYLGEALLLLLPWTLPPGWKGPSWEWRFRLITVALTLGALAATGARVATIMGVLWVIWVLTRRVDVAARTRVIAVVALVCVVAGAGLVFAGDELRGTVSYATLGERPEMWRLAGLAALERPVIGWGPDGYLAGATAVSRPEMAESGRMITLVREYADPHSLPVWIVVSTGLLGLVLFVWFMGETVAAWVREHRVGGAVDPGAWAIASTTIVLFTAPAAVQILPLFALVWGASLRPRQPAAQGRIDQPRPQWHTSLVVALTLVSLVLVVNASTRWSLELRSSDVTPRRAAVAQAASDVWRLDAYLAYLSSLHWSYAGIQDAPIAQSGRNLSSIERALAFDRRNPLYALENARILWFTDAPGPAVEAAFLEAFERYPAYPLAHAEYAVFLAQAGRLEEARANIAIARLASDTDAERLAAIESAEAIIASAGP